MCRSGRMFAPTKTWRKWHVKINTNEKRFATASAVAASCIPALVLARGHRINSVPEFPLVLSTSSLSTPLTKTRDAVTLLKSIGAYPDVAKVSKSRKLRAGKGKIRGRRHRQRRGPLVVYNPETEGSVEFARAFRNIPGVETASVKALNLLQLAPGGHLGRFVIWTDSAFSALNDVYAAKKDYILPSGNVSNADISRLINSAEVQGVLRAKKGDAVQKRGGVVGVQKKNPLKNKQVLLRLNPYAKAFSEQKLGQAKVEKTEGRVYKAGETFAKILKSD